MKKLLILFSFLIANLYSFGDGAQQQIFTSASSGVSVNEIGGGISYHKITWNITGGTLSACTVAVDTSTDNISWSAGGAITGQSCTSNGASSVTGIVNANYVRMTVTAFTGSSGVPVLTVLYNAYINSPGGGGGFTPPVTGAPTVAGTNGIGSLVIQTDALAGQQLWMQTSSLNWTNVSTGVVSAIGGDVSGLIGKYQMTEGSGTTLTDTSGSGNNGTLGLSGSFLPTWNSTGLNFNGNALVNMPLALWPASKSIMICGNFTPGTNTEGVFGADNGGTAALYYDGYNGQVAWNSIVQPNSSIAQTLNGNACLTWVNGAAQHIYIGQTEQLYVQPQSTMSQGSPSSTVYLGLANSFFNGNLYTAKFWNRAITTDEVAHQYAIEKLTMTGRSVIPATSQQINKSGVVVFGCDSITIGAAVTNVNQRFPNVAMNALSNQNYYFINEGIGGWNLQFSIGGDNRNDAVRIDPLIALVPNGPHIFVEHCGSNDLAANPANPTLVETRTTTWASARRAAGWKVVLSTLLPRSVGGQYETDRIVYNTWLRSNWATFADALADFASDGTMGCPSCASNSTYFADGVHPTATGNAILANYDITSLLSLGLPITTPSNCSSSASPAVCGSADAGSVAVPTGTNPTLTVNTTAVTANNQIMLQQDESLGAKLGVTCNSSLGITSTEPVVTTRTPATSFQVTISGVVAANPVCLSYVIPKLGN